MHIHAQKIVELVRQGVLVLSGSDQHVAITTSTTISITTLIATSIVVGVAPLYVWSYRDEDRENTRLCGLGHAWDRESGA